MIARYYKFLVLVVCLSALMLIDVQAQIEEIVVTARKREESLQEVPISVTAFTAVEFNARSLTNLKEMGQVTPNVVWGQNRSQGASTGQLFIRGVGQIEPSIFWDPGVGMYLDGVYLGRLHGVDMDLVELERVEVLRGPQGTLFGKNTIGGAINVISAKPGDEFAGSAEVTFGEFNRIDAKGSIDVPIVPGVLTAKLSGATRNRDGYGARLAFPTGEKTDDQGDVDRQTGRALINWTPTENLDFLLSIDGTKVREKDVVFKTVAIDPNAGLPSLLNILANPPLDNRFLTDSNFTNYATGGNKRDLDNWGVALTAAWDLGDYALKSITGYRNVDSLLETEGADGTPFTLLNAVNPVKQDQFSQELQLSSTSFDDRLEWVLGFYYFEESGSDKQIIDVFAELAGYPPIIPGLLPLDASVIIDMAIDNQAYAFFGQGTYRVTDQLSITGGVRYTEEEKEVSRQYTSRDGTTVLTPFATRNGNWSDWSGTASLQYQWTEDLMTYFTASRGFKSGGLNGRSISDAEFVAFDPEYIWTYELGIKSEWFANRLRFNASVFYSDYTDRQFGITRVDPKGRPINIYGNAAASEIKGFEIELFAQPTSGLSLQAGIGYTDAEYTEVDPTTGITTDTKFSYIPEWTVMLAGEYTAPVRDWGELTGRIDYAYKSKHNFDAQNLPFAWQEGYGLVNARLTFQPQGENWSNWSVSLFGTNLTDKEYTLGAGDFFDSLGIASGQYMRPREWGVSVNYRF